MQPGVRDLAGGQEAQWEKVMRIPHRKLFTQRQLARLDAYWWAASDAALRIMKAGIWSPAEWNYKDNHARCLNLDEFDEAIRWFTEMKRGRHGS